MSSSSSSSSATTVPANSPQQPSPSGSLSSSSSSSATASNHSRSQVPVAVASSLGALLGLTAVALLFILFYRRQKHKTATILSPFSADLTVSYNPNVAVTCPMPQPSGFSNSPNNDLSRLSNSTSIAYTAPPPYQPRRQTKPVP
jgi:hypothetical protein